MFTVASVYMATVFLVFAAFLTAVLMYTQLMDRPCPPGTVQVLTGQVTVPVKGIPMRENEYQCQ